MLVHWILKKKSIDLSEMEQYSAGVDIWASVCYQRLMFIYILNGADFLSDFLLQLHMYGPGAAN